MNNLYNDSHCLELFNVLSSNFGLHEIIFDDEGKPVDYRFLAVNTAMEKAIGLKAADIIGRTARQLFPKTEQYWIDKFAEVALTGIATQYENYSSELDRYFELKLFSPVKGQFAMLATDITEQVLARKKLSEAKEHFELLFNLYPESVTISRMDDGTIADINEGYSKLTGYTRSDVIGKTTTELNLWVNPNDRIKFRDHLTNYGYCDNFEALFRCKDGHIITGIVSAVTFKIIDQLNILSVTRDITNLKNAEKTLRENERMLNESQKVAGLGSYKLNFRTGIWTGSEVLDSIFGIDVHFPRTIEGWVNIIHPDCRDEMARYMQNDIIEQHNKFDKEYKIIRQTDQQVRWVHGLGKLIFNSRQELRYMIGTVMDITERKATDIIIQQQNKELRELNNTNNKLFSIIAHDLRNPFNILLNFSELMMSSLDEFDKNDIHKLAEQMNIVSKQTFILLENLLEWFRFQTGRMKPHHTQSNLRTIALDVLALARELAANKNIEISNLIKPHMMVYCDIEMTKTILRNLISNAIKFTPAKGQITINAIQKHAMVEVTVKDTGIGIKHETIPQLFTLSNTYTTPGTDNETGSGLGLMLCKELVEIQGGKIRVESQPGKGTTFYFSLPHSQGY
jgi:PAS domain S-box-containing protein